jgi:hypothetical protein
MVMKSHFCISYLSFKLGGDAQKKTEVSKSIFENTWFRAKNIHIGFTKSKSGKRLLLKVDQLTLRLAIKYIKFDVIMNNVLGRDRESLPAAMAINIS